MRSSLVGISLSVLLSLAGCSSIFGSDADLLDVELATQRAVHEPGEHVAITLHNRTPHRLETDLCLVPLDAREGDGWERVPYEGLWVCVAVAQIVEPHDSAAGVVPLPSDLAAGEYRARTWVRRMDGGEGQDVTAVFRVAP